MKNNEKVVLHYIKLTNLQSFENRLPKIVPTYRSKWLIRGTKHRKDNELQNLELPSMIS